MSAQMAHTLGYLEWRKTIAREDQYLHNAIPDLCMPELIAAYNSVLVGLAREQLAPEESTGDFHFAAGMIISEMRNRGYKL